ncbi:structural protein [Lactococcus phage LW4]|uniref:Structural protein n=4 Tax=Teubervirus LW31 TaxID=2845420 RepID=A0A1W6JI01_9CAUD|nr:virion structural protein [Lactococcus phage LW31]ARM65687.1 structural protein [Lactococcus phage LW31]ARM65774.1 structural protein [Lactococcus phage LW32]ARM65860.1 structural protein [Lactococcus phage LW33]ARM65947.1 structural protein [Lactococcus phage LW4]
MTIMRFNGKNIYIPKDATAELAALKQKQKDDVDMLVTTTTNRDSRTNGRIDGTLIEIGDLDTRLKKLEIGEGENWQGPLDQEATRRLQADTNLKNQLDQEIGQRNQLQNDYTGFRDSNKPHLDLYRKLHEYDRTFVPRIPDWIGHYPGGKGSTGQLGNSLLLVRRDGNTVHIQGELVVRQSIPANIDQPIFDLPQDCVPYVDVNGLMQGSGGSQWLLTIKRERSGNSTGGAILSRYRNGASNIEASVGAWLPINISYQILPIGPDGNIDPAYTFGASPQWRDDPTYALATGSNPVTTDMTPRNTDGTPL